MEKLGKIGEIGEIRDIKEKKKIGKNKIKDKRQKIGE